MIRSCVRNITRPLTPTLLDNEVSAPDWVPGGADFDWWDFTVAGGGIFQDSAMQVPAASSGDPVLRVASQVGGPTLNGYGSPVVHTSGAMTDCTTGHFVAAARHDWAGPVTYLVALQRAVISGYTTLVCNRDAASGDRFLVYAWNGELFLYSYVTATGHSVGAYTSASGWYTTIAVAGPTSQPARMSGPFINPGEEERTPGAFALTAGQQGLGLLGVATADATPTGEATGGIRLGRVAVVNAALDASQRAAAQAWLEEGFPA